MDNIDNEYDSVIIGCGLSGAATTLVTSINDNKTLNISLPIVEKKQEQNSSIGLIGWLLTGVTAYYDKYPFLFLRFLKMFNQISKYFPLRNKEKYGNKPYSVLCSPRITEKTRIKHEGQKLEELSLIKRKLVQEKAAKEIEDYDHVRRLLGVKNIDPENVAYLGIQDLPYDSSRIINQFKMKASKFGAIFKQLNSEDISIKKSKNNQGYDLIIKGKVIRHKHLYICAGAKSFELLFEILKDPETIHETFQDEELIASEKWSRYFIPIVIKTPVVSIKNVVDVDFQVLADIGEDLGIVRNIENGNLIISSNSHCQELYGDSIFDIPENQEENKKNQDLLIEKISAYFGFDVKNHVVKAWTCNRIERRFIKDAHAESFIFKALYDENPIGQDEHILIKNKSVQSISNWSGSIYNYHSISIGISGKGSLGILNAVDMTTNAGQNYMEINNIFSHSKISVTDILETENIDNIVELIANTTK